MRRVAALCVLLLAALPAPGAPRPAAPPPPGEPAQQFALALHNVAQQVHDTYIHPVPVPVLLHAALSGLYESARLSVPLDLKERIDKAAARGELILLIQETHSHTAAALTALGRPPVNVACQALFRSLDPYSGVVNPEEQRRNLALDQDAGGIGVDLFDYSGAGPLLVKTVHPGGSAQRAGFRPGDRITYVNGIAVGQKGADSQKLLPALRVDVGTPQFDPITGKALNSEFGTEPVKITFQHPGGRPRTVDLEQHWFHVETVLGTGRDDGHRWHYWADYKKRIAHVRISMLSHGTAEELAAVLERLQDDEMRGLILDLRWTPGGYLDDSVEVARMFLGDVTVATVKARQEEDTVYRGGGPSKLTELPLVVLVNGETSGGAELIAAALQDHKRAVIVGQRTLGKASVQRPLHVELPGVQMKLTTGTFFRPSGKNLHRFPESKPGDDWGVKPDVEFRLSTELSRQLKGWWLEQTLRPGPSLERLPLDDPSADAQRQAAVDAIKTR